MAICRGRRSVGRTSRSITTDVSSNPSGSPSETRIDTLRHSAVHIFAELFTVDSWRDLEDFADHDGIDKSPTSHRTLFADWFGMAHHDISPTLVQSAHNATTVVAQFSLTYLLGHIDLVSPWTSLSLRFSIKVISHINAVKLHTRTHDYERRETFPRERFCRTGIDNGERMPVCDPRKPLA